MSFLCFATCPAALSNPQATADQAAQVGSKLQHSAVGLAIWLTVRPVL
jgi:hypothetical protein